MSKSRGGSRTYNSIANSLVGIIVAIFNVLLNFAVRIVIVKSLGEEINGLHSLFHNIVSMMTLVETSMCTAMITHLYGVVKYKDVNKLSDILSFYQRIYLGIAAVFFVACMVLNFFLDILITTSIPMSKVHSYFFIFSFVIVLNCITYTYRLVLFAEQKNRISAIATLVAEIIFRGTAAVIAISLKSYTLFLICFIGEKLLGNLICKIYVKKTHPGICCTQRQKTDNVIKVKIMNTVKPLIVSRVADIVQNSSQGILISFLLGNIAIVGYYGNYVLVTGAVGIMYSQLGAAFTSSFGNLATEGNSEHMYKAYKKADFIMSSMATVIFVGFVTCIQDFISLAFGENFLLNRMSVAIIAVSMLISLISIPIISIQNATGTHKEDVHYMLIQAVLSVVLGYIGGKIWKMEGLLLGSMVPLFLFTTLVKGIKVHNVIFKVNSYKYIVSVLKYIFIGASSCFITIGLTSRVNFNSLILNILCKGIISVFISMFILGITLLKSDSFKEVVMILKNKKK